MFEQLAKGRCLAFPGFLQKLQGIDLDDIRHDRELFRLQRPPLGIIRCTV
jgi:hypothetical protein